MPFSTLNKTEQSNEALSVNGAGNNEGSSEMLSRGEVTLHTTPSYLTIIQDPYPPLNNSPDFNGEVASGVTYSNNQMSFIDYIDMNEFESGIGDIKKEDLFNTSDNNNLITFHNGNDDLIQDD